MCLRGLIVSLPPDELTGKKIAILRKALQARDDAFSSVSANISLTLHKPDTGNGTQYLFERTSCVFLAFNAKELGRYTIVHLAPSLFWGVNAQSTKNASP